MINLTVEPTPIRVNSRDNTNEVVHFEGLRFSIGELYYGFQFSTQDISSSYQAGLFFFILLKISIM